MGVSDGDMRAVLRANRTSRQMTTSSDADNRSFVASPANRALFDHERFFATLRAGKFARISSCTCPSTPKGHWSS